MSRIQVVINRDTAAQYRGRLWEPDGTVSDIYYIPVEDSIERLWTTPPPYVTLPRTISTPLKVQPSAIISPDFDTIIADPNDFSVLRLYLSDMERQLSQPVGHMEICLDRWQLAMNSVRENIGDGPKKEIMRIENEFEAARSETRARPLQAQREFLKVLITVAYRHTVPAVQRVRDSGLQTESLNRLEKKIEKGVSASRGNARDWLQETCYSVIHGGKEFAKLSRTTMNGYMIGLESEDGLLEEFDTWLQHICGNIHEHSFNIYHDIDEAGRAFRKQLETDKRASNVKQFLPSLLTAFTRSVGVMLDASVRVQFGEMVKEFKAFYMRILRLNPLKTYQDAVEFVEKWSKLHNELLKMLMLKGTFHVGAPSVDEIKIVLARQGHELSTPPMEGTSNSGGNQSSNLCVNKPGWKTGTKTSLQIQLDIASSKSVPDATNPAPPKTDEPAQDLVPASSDASRPEKSKVKWYKRFMARTKKGSEKTQPPID